MRTRFEHRELDAYEIQLRAAGAEVIPEASKVVAKGALNIKNDARRLAPQGPHTPHYARSISYDTAESKTSTAAEIGPDLERRQGPLGHIFEYGSPTSPPRPHLAPAGDAEEPRFVQAMEDLAARILEQHKR